jgi:AraC-like DNA-binding protein
MIFESDLDESTENNFSVDLKNIPDTFTGRAIRNALIFFYKNAQRSVVSQLIAIPSFRIWDHFMKVDKQCTLHPTTTEAGLKMHFMLSDAFIPATVQHEGDNTSSIPTPVALKSGEIILVNLPQGSHDAAFQKGQYNFFHLDIAPSLIIQLCKNKKIANLWKSIKLARKQGQTQINSFPIPISVYCMHLVEQIRQHEFQVTAAEFYLKKKCIQLIEYFAEEFAKQGKPPRNILTPKDINTLDNVKGAIKQQLHENYNAQTLGKEFNIPEKTLAHNFKQLFHCSIQHFSRDFKMEHAFKRIINKDFPVDKLAQSLGYKSTAAFSRAFRNYWGLLPA